MKFGQYIKSNSVVEWQSQYINYKQLKKRLKKLEKIVDEEESQLPPKSEGVDQSLCPRITPDHPAYHEFFAALESEVDRINAFYIQMEGRLVQRWSDLFNALQHTAHRGKQAAALHSIIESTQQSRIQKSLRIAFIDFYRALKLLEQYTNFNPT
eukprot:TRINITY_DN7724_c0_g1::TRINITY_DN7724_c0_g1_i1::g.8189::m.8189 TRINITY_DN7724_c0_g1::TRINITY_DN7724_c0_g1_i1::g.8189  ORF type:complete len:154 (+),score=1.40,sp/Q9R031/XPR1_MUSMC/29.88/3e-09,SPX/PF03105.14/6.4e-18,PspB/PF06667.7/0.096,Occludin_ELL/PF07303.8/0.44,Occludin_ELL/PF07303.8/2.1e+02,Cytochrom_B562/PF07361.6/0.12,Cytochrom_B562/PF07361.6/2.4e+03 TRINITY_DN7724_c0_g1_i1:62-523(+)